MPTEAPLRDGVASRISICGLEARVRPVRLRLPFKFGATTLRACPQIFVRATVGVHGSNIANGFAAELMVPGWFDKRPERGPEQNIRDLARSFELAASAYMDDPEGSPFGLFSRSYREIAAAGTNAGMTSLSACFGQSVIDRAIIDAACRSLGCSFLQLVRTNSLGLCHSNVASDLAGFRWDDWLRERRPAERIAARHTIGMLDALDGPLREELDLPVDLRAIVKRYGHRYFKIKLGGELDLDRVRLREILTVLADLQPDFRFTLDGNEQYPDLDALDELIKALQCEQLLRQRPGAFMFLEQPVARDRTFERPVRAIGIPLLIDEADDSVDAFPRARSLGWTGVSSKGCKGIYKSFINAARCEAWNRELETPRFFMSAEDLSCQAGLAVQQDLAIAAVLHLEHAERNGHHYADGMAGVPKGEATEFLARHPSLYESSAGHPRLRVECGSIDVRDLLAAPGFAHSADPAFDEMRPLSDGALML